MPVMLSVALAALPILVLLALMIGLRWSTAAAGLIALIATLVIAIAAFGFGADEVGRIRGLTGVLAEAGFSTATIAWILLPALAIHDLQQRTGSIDLLQRAMRGVSGEPAVIALLVAWFFALFLEGVAGFGTPVALAAPFLTSMGFPPIAAVSLALIGHAVGGSFGAIGTPILAQVTATGASGLEVARATASYVLVLGWLIPVSMMVVLRRERRDVTPRYGLAVIAAGLFIVPFAAVAWWVGPELPTLAGGLGGGLVFAIVARHYARGGAVDPGASIGARRLLVAAAPYLCVVLLVLGTRLLAPIRDATSVLWEWTLFDRYAGGLEPLRHPGTLLFGSLLGAAVIQRATLAQLRGALTQALRQLAPVVVALITVLAVSRLMMHAGMISALAVAVAHGTGPVWALLAPFAGVLGTFLTGSATASNILFSDFQATTAVHAELEVPRALGAQGFGAATGNMIAPMNVVAGAATVGLVGHEGEILRRTLGVCLGYAALGGLLTWVLARSAG